MAKKLTDQEIYEIYNTKGSLKDIAKKYNVSESTVRRIKKLEYKKYKEIIQKFSKEKNQENKDQLTQTSQFTEITKDQFAGVLFNILVKYIQPEIAKYLIDNYIISEKVSQLIDGLIVKINEVKSVDFYKESLVTITTLLLQKVLQPEYIVKLFNEKENHEAKGIKETKNK